MKEHKVPIWNGEFGPVYVGEEVEEGERDKVNQQRYDVLGEQLRIYRADLVSWSIWLYKDIGFQGEFSLPDLIYLLDGWGLD